MGYSRMLDAEHLSVINFSVIPLSLPKTCQPNKNIQAWRAKYRRNQTIYAGPYLTPFSALAGYVNRRSGILDSRAQSAGLNRYG
jgi:hypothetical protein